MKLSLLLILLLLPVTNAVDEYEDVGTFCSWGDERKLGCTSGGGFYRSAGEEYEIAECYPGIPGSIAPIERIWVTDLDDKSSFLTINECGEYCLSTYGEKCIYNKLKPAGKLFCFGMPADAHGCRPPTTLMRFETTKYNTVYCPDDKRVFERYWFSVDNVDGSPKEFDTLVECAEDCVLNYGELCIHKSQLFVKPVRDITEAGTGLAPSFTQPVKTPVRNELQYTCPNCLSYGGVWCEDRDDSTKGRCIDPANPASYCEGKQRAGDVSSCDDSCTKEEPVGECVDILNTHTTIAGGYFVAGFCQSKSNAAYQCFVAHEYTHGINSCNSCLEFYDGAAWCQTGSTNYCTVSSTCIGERIEDITKCDDYQAPEIEDGGVFDGYDASVNWEDVRQTNPDLWQGFLNWLGWRG